MVESWKGDAKGMLVFVGLHIISQFSAYNIEIVDWSILRCGCGIARIVRPEYSAGIAGHLSLLSRKYLSRTFYPIEWVQTFNPVQLVRPHRTVHSTYFRRLGQRALVLESGHQSDLRAISNIATTVGASLPKGCSPTLQPPQAGTYSCIL